MYSNLFNVFVLFTAGEMMSVAAPFLEQQIHPTVIISAFRQALDDLTTILDEKIRYRLICGYMIND